MNLYTKIRRNPTLMPYAEISNRLMLNPSQTIRVHREEDSAELFPPLSAEALATKIQQEWGKQPGKVQVRIGDNLRSPESYLVWVE